MHCTTVIVNCRKVKACCLITDGCLSDMPFMASSAWPAWPAGAATEPSARGPGSVRSSASRRTEVRGAGPSGGGGSVSRPHYGEAWSAMSRRGTPPRLCSASAAITLLGRTTVSAPCPAASIEAGLPICGHHGFRDRARSRASQHWTALGPSTKRARYPYLAPRSLWQADISHPLE